MLCHRRALFHQHCTCFCRGSDSPHEVCVRVCFTQNEGQFILCTPYRPWLLFSWAMPLHKKKPKGENGEFATLCQKSQQAAKWPSSLQIGSSNEQHPLVRWEQCPRVCACVYVCAVPVLYLSISIYFCRSQSFLVLGKEDRGVFKRGPAPQSSTE